MKKLIILAFAFLMMISFVFASHSTNIADYLYWDDFDRADSDLIGNAKTGQSNLEVQGDVDIVNKSLKTQEDTTTDAFCTNITNQTGVNPTRNFTVDLYINLSGNPDGYHAGIQFYSTGDCTGFVGAGVKVHGADNDFDYWTGSWTEHATSLVYDQDTQYLIRFYFNQTETTKRYNFTIINVTNGQFKDLLSKDSITYANSVTSFASFRVFDDSASQAHWYYVPEIAIYNGTSRPQQTIVDTTPPEITFYNMTSEGGEGCTNWNTNKSNPCVTNDTTPTIFFKTNNENAFCAIGISNLNYSGLGSSRNCTGGEGTTEHTCTLIPQDELTIENSFIYLSCKDTTGNQNRTSTSGALALSVQAKETGAAQAIGIGIQNALLSDYINYTNQQISARNLNNNQFLGTFDRVAKKDTKVWAFNYISSGESHVANTFNLTPVLYVLQLTNATQQQVTLEVERLINATK